MEIRIPAPVRGLNWKGEVVGSGSDVERGEDVEERVGTVGGGLMKRKITNLNKRISVGGGDRGLESSGRRGSEGVGKDIVGGLEGFWLPGRMKGLPPVGF